MPRDTALGRIRTMVMAGAIVVAPFIALLVRAEAGLLVMAIALGATSMLVREALPATPNKFRHRLRLVIALNVALAVACVAFAVWLVVRN